MALPNDALSTTAVLGNYISPYDRYSDDLTDYELGGSAIGVSDDGLEYQVWSLRYENDEDSPDYGDFVITGETTGEVVTPINVANVVRCCLAFDQNMNVFIGYETEAGQAYHYWYDTLISGYKTTTMDSGVRSLQCCLDDHRVTQSGTSDIILAYIRSGNLCYRQQRDRYGTEYVLKSGVGGAEIYRVGMSDIGRLQFDVRQGRGNRLSEIVGDLCLATGMRATDFDVSALQDIFVRGFITAGHYSASETIKTLQNVYFFDMPEVDGKLVAVLRGGDTVGTISNDDLVKGADLDIETAREQGIEFPYKVHLEWAAAETDYTPTKETAERRSPDVKAVSEMSVNTGVNFERDEAAQVVDIFQKTAWAEFEGKVETILPESYAYLNASDPVLVEVRPDTFKRMRIRRWSFTDGAFEVEMVIDRKSAYSSGATGAEVLTPTVPGPRLPGDASWEFMALPSIYGGDVLHYYVAAERAEGRAWTGAELQMQIGSEFYSVASVGQEATMGTLQAALPDAPEHYIDRTNTILADLNNTPESISTEDIIQGRGAWLIGDEIVQVRDWNASGDYWAGSYITRGRRNTSTASHSSGARIVYLPESMPVTFSQEYIGAEMTFRMVPYGLDETSATQTAHTLSDISMTEWSPIDLVSGQSGSDWEFSWTPRYRMGTSANPLPSNDFYGWRLRFTVGSTTAVHDVESTTPEYTYTSAQQTTDFGSAQASFDTVEIRALNRISGEGDALSEAVS